jgi:hypothetical protein
MSRPKLSIIAHIQLILPSRVILAIKQFHDKLRSLLSPVFMSFLNCLPTAHISSCRLQSSVAEQCLLFLFFLPVLSLFVIAIASGSNQEGISFFPICHRMFTMSRSLSDLPSPLAARRNSALSVKFASFLAQCRPSYGHPSVLSTLLRDPTQYPNDSSAIFAVSSNVEQRRTGNRKPSACSLHIVIHTVSDKDHIAIWRYEGLDTTAQL